jgi:hypothetical protein
VMAASREARWLRFRSCLASGGGLRLAGDVPTVASRVDLLRSAGELNARLIEPVSW